VTPLELIQNLMTVRRMIWRFADVVEKALPKSAIDLPENGDPRLPIDVEALLNTPRARAER
jgi:hypothetical protein